MRENFVSKAWMKTGMGSMFSELCRWEVEVRLGWLLMTRICLDWMTEVDRGACVAPDRFISLSFCY